MSACQRCGKPTFPHRRIGLKLASNRDRTVYYCWLCADAALKSGEAFTMHILAAKRIPPEFLVRSKKHEKPN